MNRITLVQEQVGGPPTITFIVLLLIITIMLTIWVASVAVRPFVEVLKAAVASAAVVMLLVVMAVLLIVALAVSTT